MQNWRKYELKKQSKILFHFLSIPFFVVVGIFVAFSFTFGFIESKDSFCASCHVEPEGKYYRESLENKNPETLAAYHRQKKTNCIDCHSRSFITGRLWAQYGGLKNYIAYKRGNYRNPGKTRRPVGESGCTKCHSDIFWAVERPAHYHSPQLRSSWRDAGGIVNSCESCHPSHNKNGNKKNKKISIAGKTEIFSLNARQMKERCEDCHERIGIFIKK